MWIFACDSCVCVCAGIEMHANYLEYFRKAIESKRKELEEKEKKLIEFDRQLQKRKEQMDQLEKSLQKVGHLVVYFKWWKAIVWNVKSEMNVFGCFLFQAGGTAAAAGELNKKLTDAQRQLET